MNYEQPADFAVSAILLALCAFCVWTHFWFRAGGVKETTDIAIAKLDISSQDEKY